MNTSGTTLFARYAYPPNELGYCGPDDASVLLRRGSAAAQDQIAEHARQFEGAWAYLEIIAEAAGIADPLDARVVEAYWIGNELLDHVEQNSLVSTLRERFGDQAGASWVPGPPHHGFQVFSVYPWVGLLRRGTGDVALSVLEQCRIRWGEVVAIEGERVRVRARSLVVADGLLELGPAQEHTAAWSVDGRTLLPAEAADGSLAPPVSVGDQIAMHWDWVCDVLSAAQVAQLELRTTDQLARTNAGLRAAAG
ncbi:MAG: hypothetical protein QOF87_402 [Pseudonocardiales bacterium]|nr:hypothetical protein [Pseudonocardiales bacterium]